MSPGQINVLSTVNNTFGSSTRLAITIWMIQTPLHTYLNLDHCVNESLFAMFKNFKLLHLGFAG